MANMNFGVNILPKTNNTYTLGNSDYKWNIYANQLNGTAISNLVLPTVSSTDNGKILQVSGGQWTAATQSIPTKVSDLTNDSGFLTAHQDISGKADTADLAGVAFSGDYDDLINTPTAISSFTNDSGYLTVHQDISGKANSADLATVATTGSYTDLINKPDLSQYLTSVPVMTGATSSAAGTAGLIPAPTTADREKFFRGDGTWQDGGRPMVILSYGNSTWAQFLAAYQANVIVYCRASSNTNPASGSQTRMAFMAYVNNSENPTEVEFQYYRSVSSHTATQMGDQVFVYKLTSNGTWTVTTREASIKEIVAASGTKLSVAWASNKVTLTNTMTAADMPMSSNDVTTVGSKISGLTDQIAPFLSPTYSTLTLESGVTGTIYIMRMGKIRMLTGYVNPNTHGTSITIATLSSSDKPPVDIRGPYSSYGVTATGEIRIKSNDGIIELAINSDPGNTIKFNLMYAVA